MTTKHKSYISCPANMARLSLKVRPWLLFLILSALFVLAPINGQAPGLLLANAEQPTAKDKAVENLFNPSIAKEWKAIKEGKQGAVSIPDKKSAILIQPSGQQWRSFRTQTLVLTGAVAILGSLFALAIFYFFRGRITVKQGLSGIEIERFTFLERMMHWTLAISFIILALTGLNLTYGKFLLLPLIGGEAFAALTLAGKWLHNFFGFSFMIALIWTFVSWISENIPSKVDLKWLKEGGGIIGSAHPPARKFNAGQKIIFWLVILSGLSLSISGLSLMLPFEWGLFSKTNSLFNLFGFNLPENLLPVEEMQLAQAWHSLLAIFMVAVIIAHIYIGTIGMQGAFSAMSSGKVDKNWATEHHSLWVEEMRGKNQ